MKKFLIVLVLISVLLINPKNIFSQDKPYDFTTLYQDFLFSFGVYRQAESEYRLARNEYLTYGTLKSEERAIEATKKMLELRDDTIKYYLLALKARLSEAVGISDIDKSELSKQIEAEIDWFTSHKQRLPSAGPLKDLVSDSDEAKNRYQATELVIYRSLYKIASGKEKDFKRRADKIINDLNNKVVEIRSNQDKNTNLIDKGLIDAANMIARGEDKELDASKKLDKISAKEKDKFKTYSGILTTLTESHQYFKSAIDVLKQALKAIKTQD